MSEIQRLCVQCGTANALDARYCAHCGYDTQSALPVPRPSLPAVVGAAALPVLVGAASFALRMGWRLVQSRAAQQAARKAVQVVAPQPAPTALAPKVEALPAPPTRRTTIRIRSTWAMGDANGVWRQGVSEHTIEIDE
jgi:hypothetical protein